MSKQKQTELDQNELAVWMAKVNKSIEPYSKLILVGVVALMAGWVYWGLRKSSQSEARSDSTYSLLMNDPEVADKYPGTSAAAWSTLYSGNKDLESGIQSLYADRTDAEILLNEAKDSFNKAVSISDDKLLLSRGYLGIALASESLGQLDEAIEAYEKCAEIDESKAMVEKAQSRIEELSRPDTKAFVAWFDTQDFSPKDPSLPPELPGGSSLPELPDLNLSPLLSGEQDEMSLEDTPGKIELPEGGEAVAEEMTGEEMTGEEKASGETNSETKTGGLDLPTGESIKAAAKDATGTVTEKAGDVVEAATEKAGDAVEAATEKAGDVVETVTETVTEKAGDVVEKATEVVEEAVDSVIE